MYIDTHTHLNDEELDAEQVIQNFEKDEIDYAITVSYDEPSCEQNFEIANKHSKVFCAVGVHPHDSKTFDQRLSNKVFDYKGMDKQNKVVAIGEIGLDYYYDLSPREDQKRAFAEQIQLAHSLKLPIIIHSREAIFDTNEVLKQNSKYLEYGGVVHCYANGEQFVPFYQDLGLYISFTGVITFKNASKILNSCKAVAKDRILTETDCPYMTPEPFRGRTNEPKNVKYIAQKLAEIRGEDLHEFCERVKVNSQKLFGINF